MSTFVIFLTIYKTIAAGAQWVYGMVIAAEDGMKIEVHLISLRSFCMSSSILSNLMFTFSPLTASRMRREV
jgi:hypothetical protein